MIDQPDLPIFVNHDIALIAVNVVYQVVKHPHVVELPIPVLGVRGHDLLFISNKVCHGSFQPELYGTLTAMEFSTRRRRYVVHSKNIVDAVRCYFAIIAVTKMPAYAIDAYYVIS